MCIHISDKRRLWQNRPEGGGGCSAEQSGDPGILNARARAR